eukprot:3388287-Pyramimonas_sp.AAC.2
MVASENFAVSTLPGSVGNNIWDPAAEPTFRGQRVSPGPEFHRGRDDSPKNLPGSANFLRP